MELWLILLLLSSFLAAATMALILYVLHLRKQLTEISFRKSSQSVKYGKMTEQWLPFTKDFPFRSEDFRFLGNPIDGIVFEDDEIVFCEFKTSKSQLSEKQKKIRELVKKKKVDWFEYRMS
ncbi:MAG: Holliday junction resolvase-like protein [Candidatus Diapherotrites archaeon]